MDSCFSSAWRVRWYFAVWVGRDLLCCRRLIAHWIEGIISSITNRIQWVGHQIFKYWVLKVIMSDSIIDIFSKSRLSEDKSSATWELILYLSIYFGLWIHSYMRMFKYLIFIISQFLSFKYVCVFPTIWLVSELQENHEKYSYSAMLVDAQINNFHNNNWKLRWRVKVCTLLH